jgi:endonuclease-3
MGKRYDLDKKKAKALKIIKKLKELFPKIKPSLDYSNNFELLVATILSAQCTDKMVNKVTEKLFKKYRSINNYVNADISEFEKDIRSTGFYKNKAKNIINSAKIIKKKFNNKVPNTMNDLLTLPGVARKTANIVIYKCFGKIEGVAVDTHVKRLSDILGLSRNNNPEKIEKDLMKLLPKKEWMDFTFRMVEYGRRFCPAKKHDHKNCPLSKIF